jgi:hypothetical protein
MERCDKVNPCDYCIPTISPKTNDRISPPLSRVDLYIERLSQRRKSQLPDRFSRDIR